MKNKVKPLYHMLLFIIFSFSFVNQVSGQEKINISAGIGIPELINIGVRFQLNQAQIGLSVGTLPISYEKGNICISSVYNYHFGGDAKFSNRLPWYTRLGLNYLRDEDEASIYKYLYLNGRIGRDLNISKKIGIEIDVGVNFLLHYKENIKDPIMGGGGSVFFGRMPVMPCFGIVLFYRL